MRVPLLWVSGYVSKGKKKTMRPATVSCSLSVIHFPALGNGCTAALWLYSLYDSLVVITSVSMGTDSNNKFVNFLISVIHGHHSYNAAETHKEGIFRWLIIYTFIALTEQSQICHHRSSSQPPKRGHYQRIWMQERSQGGIKRRTTRSYQESNQPVPVVHYHIIIPREAGIGMPPPDEIPSRWDLWDSLRRSLISHTQYNRSEPILSRLLVSAARLCCDSSSVWWCLTR